MPPGGVQEIEVPVLGLLGHQLHLDVVSREMVDRMTAVYVGQGPGMTLFAISDVIKRCGLGQSGIQPAPCLIDGAQVPLGWVGVGDHEPELGLLA